MAMTLGKPVRLSDVAVALQPGIVSRFRQRIFPSRASAGSVDPVPLTETSKKAITLKAGIAELLLVNRLMARSNRKAQAAEMLERASHIVFVTCQNWFSSSDGKHPSHRTPL